MKHLYNVLLVVFCTAMMPVAYAEDAPLPGDFAPQVQKKNALLLLVLSHLASLLQIKNPRNGRQARL